MFFVSCVTRWYSGNKAQNHHNKSQHKSVTKSTGIFIIQSTNYIRNFMEQNPSCEANSH